MRLIALLLACALALGAQKVVSDDTIWNDVRRRLANDPDVKGGTLEVVVKEGVVSIRGTVEKEKHKAKAERLAHKVHGVKKVINELKVKTGS